MYALRRQARWLSRLFAICFALTTLYVPAVQAGLIGTQELIGDEAQQQRDELKQLLARDDVREKLIAWGVDPASAEQRIDSLSPAELERMSAQMQDMPAGGDILGAAIFVFLVLLVTDILGYTDIFPFVTNRHE